MIKISPSLKNDLPAKYLLTGHQAELSIDGLTAALQQKYAATSPALCTLEAVYNARKALENACNNWLSEKSPSAAKPYIPFTTLTRLEEIARHGAAEYFQQRLAKNPGECRVEMKKTRHGILAHSNQPKPVLQNNPMLHPILGRPREGVSRPALDLAAPKRDEVAPTLLSSMESCRIGAAQPTGPFLAWAVSTSSQQPGNSAAAAGAATPRAFNHNAQPENPAEWPEAGPAFGYE